MHTRGLMVLVTITAVVCISGCTLLPLHRMLGYQAEEFIRETVTEHEEAVYNGGSASEKQSKDTTPEKAAAAPLTREERSDAIIKAVQEYDLDGLKALLADVEDVR
ncbi:MAG: hypothetical protein JW760_05745, partial [Spirochaetales bacterium]|nr:hypothetical protein [Spirochaetales bacterium]